ncbi:DNA circularization N-terminal domain-containing protein [Microvirga pakistanensis]|uniref:DNA circularization N-terminal domain-containing protein n=1 Tax=Microvirga pakistanensis TaxID=1682650 RepID=UPI00141AC1F4|nr:DNA circularization N-terminal domain-containing protein [Microvirga pakistanensis]
MPGIGQSFTQVLSQRRVVPSFKGIPFWVEQDGEEGRRRLPIHEFPMRNDPFIEDLGEADRQYDVTAYLVGDLSSPEASGLVAQLASRGPGLLVLPTYGPSWPAAPPSSAIGRRTA